MKVASRCFQVEGTVILKCLHKRSKDSQYRNRDAYEINPEYELPIRYRQMLLIIYLI